MEQKCHDIFAGHKCHFHCLNCRNFPVDAHSSDKARRFPLRSRPGTVARHSEGMARHVAMPGIVGTVDGWYAIQDSRIREGADRSGAGICIDLFFVTCN